MIEILFLIVLLALLSYVFCMNQNNKFSCFTTHIVVGLTGLVCYKLILYYNLQFKVKPLEDKLHLTKTENFETLPDTINNFILGEDVNRPSSGSFSTMNATSAQQYLSKLDSLVNAIEALRKDQQVTSSGLQSTNNSTLDRLNLESLQQFQTFQIQYLQNQINKTKELINGQQMAETTKKYKPIKVYSSCLVSNADGSLTKDQPIQVTNNTLNNFLNTQNLQNGINNNQSDTNQQSKNAFIDLLQKAKNASSININLTQ